jgi:signal transduction histidine kinase
MGTIIERAPARDAIFVAGGEMGARIRAFDWASTPLGPMERWPRSLCTAVDIMLASSFPIYIGWGPDFVQLYNDACRPIFGSKYSTGLGRRAADEFHEIWDWLGPIFRHVLTTGEPAYNEDRLSAYDRDGFMEETYSTASTNALRDDGGEVAGLIIMMMETTQRVLAERRMRTLRDLGAAAAAADSPGAACAIAAEILGGNPSDLPFALLYLLDERGATARRAGLAGLPPEHAAAPPEVVLAEGGGWPLAEVAAGRTARLVDDAEARFGALDCGPWPEKPCRALVLPMARAGQERPVGFLVAGISARNVLDAPYRDFLQMAAGHVATAVSDARAREEERRRAEALAELDRARTVFFGDVSHEFRTPLTLMLGPLEQLREESGVDLPPASRELLDTAHRNALRLQKLVNTLLDFARIEAGRVEAALEPVDLAALTAELAGMFRSAAERAGLRLTVDCPPLPVPVYVDPEMWEKIVLNLLSNALKFTFRGGISVALRAAGERVELVVRDTGVGIPPGDLPQLFQRFHRVRGARARSHEGSGIGLALVAELARLHGGTVRVESEEDAGTVLTVSVPRGAAGPAPAETGGARARSAPGTGAAPYVEEAARWLAAAPPEAAGGAAGPGGARILVVDDNADMRGYVARLLSARHRVEACADGSEALEAVRRLPPDLVLTDVMMPRTDGFQLLKELRAGPATSGVPVILLSARAGEEATLEGLAAGADDYLVKPFSARELLARVDAQLAMARLRLRLAATGERNRIARDLHDSATQTLISATMLAESLADPSRPGPEGLGGELRRLATLTRGAMAELRMLLTELRPEIVERSRVGHLVQQLADALRGRLQLAVSARVRDVDSERLPGEVRVAVYRVAQESLNNVVKHSRAGAVDVVLTATAHTVYLRIRDDGVGFAPGAARSGMGVWSMRERAAMIGATLRIRGRQGGTEVALRWRAPGLGAA